MSLNRSVLATTESVKQQAFTAYSEQEYKCEAFSACFADFDYADYGCSLIRRHLLRRTNYGLDSHFEIT